MTVEPTNVEKLRRLPWSIASNAANTVFVQFTFFGSVFVLFLSELGLNKTQIGSLLSLLPFCSMIALFVAPAVARTGYKRVYLTFFGARKIVAALILLTPWVLSSYGSRATLFYVAGVLGLFALFRAIAETGVYPWVQEYVPNALRGKYTALNNIFTTLTGFVAVAVAGFVIGRSSGLSGFMILFTLGILFGVISLVTASFIPGGAPVREAGVGGTRYRDMLKAFQDRDFVRYLSGTGLMTLATVPITAFLPLFMQEQVGLSPGNVVLIQLGTLAGGLLSSYVWGWAADRYGSKPVMLSGVYLTMLLPILWVLMPRHSNLSLWAALGISFLQGVANVGWVVGSTRLLYVGVVPPEKKSSYMPVYQAAIGLTGGISQLAGGVVLDLSQGLSGQLLTLTLDPYLPLFAGGLVLPLASGLLLRAIRVEVTVSVGRFAGIFFRGNPFLAMRSLIGYHLAKDEHATVLMTERLGQAKSLLTVDELLEALNDPRFNVRFEAIISIARMGPDERLIRALVDVLKGSEPALSVIAAWALGRIGDEKALTPLREALDSRYRSIQAHAARSLGTLGDAEWIPILLERLHSEPDHGLQIAYAAALGKLRAAEATETLLALLRTKEEYISRMELALALARIVGDERHFINLLRQTQTEPGTAAAQAVGLFKKRISKFPVADDLIKLSDECAEAFARDQLERGAALLSRVVSLLPLHHLSRSCAMILKECTRGLNEFGPERLEYLLLTLHTLDIGWPSEPAASREPAVPQRTST